jgi:predicted GNAT family N-acyltransferase
VSWEPVTVATTKEEREAIYRFRYSIYVDELRRKVGGVDAEGKRIADLVDELPTTVHLYVGTPDNILGAIRLQAWAAGAVPSAYFAEYSMEIIPGIETLATAELGRLMVRASARGRAVMPSLLRKASEILMSEYGTDLAFGSCRPGLVALYQRVGFRAYAGRLQETIDGLSIPIVIVYPDAEYLARVGAPFAELVGSRRSASCVDLAAITHVFRQNDSPIVTAPERVWQTLQEELSVGAAEPPTVLRGLDESFAKRLAELGLILDVPAGVLVTREGHVEREMFIVLEGAFVAFSGDRVFETMTKGDVFGEVAFFHGTGERSASVRAETDGKLVVIRRGVLAELGKTAPEATQALLFNLARVLAERVVRLSAKHP